MEGEELLGIRFQLCSGKKEVSSPSSLEPMSHRQPVVLFLAVLAILLVGCDDSTSELETSTTVREHSVLGVWHLQGVEQNGSQIEIALTPTRSEVWVALLPDGSGSGEAPCNDFQLTYQSTDNSGLDVFIVREAKDCGDPEVMSSEQTIVMVADSPIHVAFSGNTMVWTANGYRSPGPATIDFGLGCAFHVNNLPVI